MTSKRPLTAWLEKVLPADYKQPTPEELEEMGRRERARLLAEHEQQQHALTEDFLVRCGVREEQLAALMKPDQLQARQARTHVAAFMADPACVILGLFGLEGRGKTLAACESFLTRKVEIDSPYFGKSWKWGAPGVLTNARRIASLSAFNDGRAEFERLFPVPLLVVDEIGAERTSLEAALDELVDERYARRKKLILVGNLTVEEFRDRYGSRVAGRTRHRGRVVECTDQSLRVRGAP